MKTQYKINDSRMALRLFLLCWLVYFSSYLGRLNYSSAMTVMLDECILTKAQAGFISMIYFLAYGIGQCLNGFAGDKINPKWMITGGLAVSAGMNLFMTLFRNFPVMAAAWLINGYAQSTIWPPIIRIFSDMLQPEKKIKYCVDIVSTQAAGTFASYFLSAAIIAHTEWQFVFLAAAIILCLVAIIWNVGFSVIKTKAEKQVYKIETNNKYKASKSSDERPKNFFHLFLASGSIMLVVPVFVHGILKDGIVSWVPTFISETFESGAYVAILLTSVIPLVNLSGAYLGRFIFRKMKNDEIKATVLFFGIASAALLLLYWYGNENIILTIIILSAITVSMMAVNTLLINLYPLRFERNGRVASVSGLLNAVAYIGTAVSTYGIGILVQGKGWRVTILSWLFAAIVAFAVCVVGYKRIKCRMVL